MSVPVPVEAADLAALAWLVDLGADEAIADAPIDRFAAAPAEPPRPTPAPSPSSEAQPPRDAEATARTIAAACADLPALRAAMAAFDGCALKRGARSLVFADGDPAARVMIVGEAPGRDEDTAGLPFVGRSGRLLDAMFAAIGLARGAEDPSNALYIVNVLPWRPPANRDPSADEIAMMVPFLQRHIELAAPDVLALMGSSAVRTLLETSEGVTRLRGRWTTWRGVPALPMLHPAALLRDPSKKRDAWADLLTLRARLDTRGDDGRR